MKRWHKVWLMGFLVLLFGMTIGVIGVLIASGVYALMGVFITGIGIGASLSIYMLED